MTKRFGFTLAEVLITLTIIGVIAAMTIPTLLSNTADQEFKTGLKKAVSTINQAITMQYALEGTDVSDYVNLANGKIAAGGVSTLGTPKDAVTATTMFGENGLIGGLFAQRMQIIDSTVEDRRKNMGQTDSAAQNAILYLSDGMALEIPTPASKTKRCTDDAYDAATNRDGCLFSMIVDVNGDKGKCVIGGHENKGDANKEKVRPKDCFVLDVHPDGVRPAMRYAREIMYEGK